MAVFSINGRDADSLAEAQEICREEWANYKAPAVQEQHVEALSKPSDLDLQRAARGIPAPEVNASTAASVLAARADAAALAAKENE